MALLKRNRGFLPFPPVTCPECGHYASPLGLCCEKCGANLKDFLV